ncbi:unnamed protein product (mitochondrion) [Musa hybrid cultivar]
MGLNEADSFISQAKVHRCTHSIVVNKFRPRAQGRKRGPQQNSRNVGKRERSANKWLRFRSRKVLERPKGSSCAY